jgi:hypothetical protein
MKRLTKEQKKEQAIIDLLNQMFIIAGHNVTYDDIKERKDNWFNEWTMTMTQNEEWQEWGKKYLIKKLKMPTKQAEKEMQWVSLMWGLKFSDFPSNKIKDEQDTTK